MSSCVELSLTLWESGTLVPGLRTYRERSLVLSHVARACNWEGPVTLRRRSISREFWTDERSSTSPMIIGFSLGSEQCGGIGGSN